MEPPIFKNEIRVVPGPEDLPDDAELWRYMRLSSLLMLLRGKVFVPTIAELRVGDPVEAYNLSVETRQYFDRLMEADRQWLTERASDLELKILNHPDVEPRQVSRTFVGIWNRELAQRRTVWCWHHGDIESMALWHIYAREGVAVKTTPRRIKEAFDPCFVDTGLIGRVHYVDHARQEALPHHFMRPYLLKQRCYQHEREVRIVFPRDCDDPDNRRLLPLKAHRLIDEIRISPHIPRSEAAEIRQSIIQAGRTERDCESSDSDIPVFISDTTTVLESPMDGLRLNQSESTGITNFGTLTMPFVMCGDFAPSTDGQPTTNSEPVGDDSSE